MSKIHFDKIKFLDKICDTLDGYSGRDTKLEILTQEYWHDYSTGWINLIITINKDIFSVEEEDPLDGLKSAFLAEKLPEGSSSLLSTFENLTENWDDIFGSSYYEIRSSLFDFVFKNSKSILKELVKYISDPSALSELIQKYESAMRKSHESY